MSRQSSRHARTDVATRAGGADGNTRLTATLGFLLIAILFVEGITILQVGSLLTLHVFVGLLVLPVVIAKMGATSWRFVKYYWGSTEYRRKGPPPPLLRLLGPFVVVLTLAVIATGVLLIVIAPQSLHPQLLQLHQITFVLWFGATAIHVLGHLLETAKVAPLDWVRRTRRDVKGASMRQWLEVGSLLAGVVVALWITPYAGHWQFFSH
ncbi:MAG TPA: hypothetical protein VMU98_06825 [Acidimicrobiales bacterium]|nr:hypothetical protein [Acidimicrobiales bacterium]